MEPRKISQVLPSSSTKQALESILANIREVDVFHSLATGIFRSADLNLETEELVKTDQVKKVDEEVEERYSDSPEGVTLLEYNFKQLIDRDSVMDKVKKQGVGKLPFLVIHVRY